MFLRVRHLREQMTTFGARETLARLREVRDAMRVERVPTTPLRGGTIH